jgi:hypothetical protein
MSTLARFLKNFVKSLDMLDLASNVTNAVRSKLCKISESESGFTVTLKPSVPQAERDRDGKLTLTLKGQISEIYSFFFFLENQRVPLPDPLARVQEWCMTGMTY